MGVSIMRDIQTRGWGGATQVEDANNALADHTPERWWMLAPIIAPIRTCPAGGVCPQKLPSCHLMGGTNTAGQGAWELVMYDAVPQTAHTKVAGSDVWLCETPWTAAAQWAAHPAH